MKYLLLICGTQEAMQDAGPDVMERHYAMAEEAIRRDTYVTCDALESTASAAEVRVVDGKVARTDGPFAESKEIVGGFYMVDCASMDEAVELAAMIPAPRGGYIEVRPVFTIPGWDERIAEIRQRVGASPVG